MTSPTPPTFAASLWLEAGYLHLDLPSTTGHLHHRLTVKDDAEGWARVKFLIQHRSHKSQLGTEGDLTQWQIDKLQLNAMGWEATGEINRKPGGITYVKKASPATKAAAKAVLQRFGLIAIAFALLFPLSAFAQTSGCTGTTCGCTDARYCKP